VNRLRRSRGSRWRPLPKAAPQPTSHRLMAAHIPR
jgi:hypothetical protein